MLKQNLHILLLLAVLLLVGCGTPNTPQNKESKSAKKESVETKRYGVDIAGYELRTHKLSASQTLGDIMRKYGRSTSDVSRLDKASKEHFSLRRMRVGNEYTLFLKKDSLGRDRVEYIAYECDQLNYVLFVMRDDSIAVRLGEKPQRVVHQCRRIVVENSLLGSIRDNKLPYDLGIELERIFQWSIDLFNLKRGDIFTVLYEEMFVDDTLSVGIRKIRGAKFERGSELLYAIPYEQRGVLKYWDSDGCALKMQLLKSPLRYSRVNCHSSVDSQSESPDQDDNTSLSVEYSVPTGTSIYAVADGVVSYRGFDAVDGETIIIRHDNKIKSGYHHLSRYARGVKSGAKIAQGELIGYVGSSGSTSTPSLLYRLWFNDVEVDPLNIPDVKLEPIEDKNRAEFESVRDQIISELNEGEITK